MAIVIEGSGAVYRFILLAQGLFRVDLFHGDLFRSDLLHSDLFRINLMQVNSGSPAIEPIVQPSIQPIVQPILFSGSVWTQLLTAIVVGLLVAFALQVLLTSLGLAIGMSVLAIRASSTPTSEVDSDRLDAAEIDIENEAESLKSESSGVQLGFWAGFGVLLTVNTVLFAACFLAARFSQAGSSITGAIEGIVIWSAYLLILIWLSSTAVSSVVGSLLSVTTGGFRKLIRPIGALFTSEEPAAVTEAEMLSAVRQEIQAAFDPEQLQSMIRSELQRSAAIPVSVLQNPENGASSSKDSAAQTRSAQAAQAAIATLQQQLVQFLQESDKLTPKRVDRHLRQILEAAQNELSDSALMPEIDRSIAMHLLMQREDLSEKQREKILNQIEETWNEVGRSAEGSRSTQDSDEYPIAESESNGSGASNPAIQQLTETALKTIANQLPDALTDNAAVEQVLKQLPQLMQQAGNQLPTGASLAMLTMALIKGKDLLPENGIDPQQIKQTLDRLMAQSGMPDLNHAVVEQVDHLRDRSMQQIEQVQHTVQETVETLKTQTQQQLQATQKAATIAAWWLFLTVSTGAISAAVAGAIANQI